MNCKFEKTPLLTFDEATETISKQLNYPENTLKQSLNDAFKIIIKKRKTLEKNIQKYRFSLLTILKKDQIVSINISIFDEKKLISQFMIENKLYTKVIENKKKKYKLLRFMTQEGPYADRHPIMKISDEEIQ